MTQFWPVPNSGHFSVTIICLTVVPLLTLNILIVGHARVLGGFSSKNRVGVSNKT